MAIATGTAIALGATALSGALQTRGQNKATDASVDATDKALAFSQEQQKRADAAYEERMQIWQASRQALLDKYGIDIAPPTMQGPGGPGGEGPREGPQGGLLGNIRDEVLRQSAAGRVPGGAPQGPPGAMPQGMAPGVADAKGLSGRNLGELASLGKPLGSWNDWSRMGLGGRG